MEDLLQQFVDEMKAINKNLVVLTTRVTQLDGKLAQSMIETGIREARDRKEILDSKKKSPNWLDTRYRPVKSLTRRSAN